jgi:hypothetical protein
MRGIKMRNLLNKITGKVSAIATRTKAAVCNKRGEGYIGEALKILIAVVLGAMLLAGLYLLFNTIILPTLSDKITDLFNYTS